MVMVAASTSRRWRSAHPPELAFSAATDRTLQAGLVGALVVQLVLGAIQRHLAQGLIIHITLAAIVTIMVIAAGARAWGLYHGSWPVQRLGQLLMSVVVIQVALGIAALAVTQGRAVVGHPTTLEVTIATAHQAAGAGCSRSPCCSPPGRDASFAATLSDRRSKIERAVSGQIRNR
jgi:hypothetical protein